MPGCNHVSTHLHCAIKKCVKLDFPVAHHIRIRGAPLGIFVKHVVHNFFLVYLAKVNEVERYSYLPGYEFGHETVFFPFAVSVQRASRVVPVLHEQAEYIISRFFQQQGGHA